MTPDETVFELVEQATWPLVLQNGRWVRLCPPGNAEGCFDLRDRGRQLSEEITVWGSSRTHRYCLTTGSNHRGPQLLKRGSASESYQFSLLAKELAALYYVSPIDAEKWLRTWNAKPRQWEVAAGLYHVVPTNVWKEIGRLVRLYEARRTKVEADPSPYLYPRPRKAA